MKKAAQPQGELQSMALPILLLTSDRNRAIPIAMNTKDERKNVLQGTLDLLILRIVSAEALHGWGIMQRLKQLTGDVFQVTPGSLFPALQRLEESGWVEGKWGTSENNRKAKFYSITKAGRKQLVEEKQNWAAITTAVTRVLEGA